MRQIYKMTVVYEWPERVGEWLRFVRIEVFECISQPKNFRARVWLDENYNLYPTRLNSDQNGNAVNMIHSSDVVNRDITSLLSGADEWICGKVFASEEDFVSSTMPSVNEVLDALKRT